MDFVTHVSLRYSISLGDFETEISSKNKPLQKGLKKIKSRVAYFRNLTVMTLFNVKLKQQIRCCSSYLRGSQLRMDHKKSDGGGGGGLGQKQKQTFPQKIID